jgi:hypothetical protein
MTTREKIKIIIVWFFVGMVITAWAIVILRHLGVM